MKNRGFTLIELLAVIVILAIIALIVAPIILGIITDAKKSSTKESARAYLKAIEQQTVMNLIGDNVELTDGIFDVPIAGINISGQTPDDGWVVIKDEGILNYALKYGDFIITYETGEMIIKTGGVLPAKP